MKYFTDVQAFRGHLGVADLADVGEVVTTACQNLVTSLLSSVTVD
jgi:hypothetical protein